MSITQPKNPAMGSEHAEAPATADVSPLKTPEPQKCCSGGNCAECGKQQPVIESSPEIAASEQRILSGDFAGFFDSLTSSRDAVGQTIGIGGVVTSGEGSVVQVGQTAGTFGTISPSESALRYHEAPSSLLSDNPAITPNAERLVSIGSVPKQTTTEGLSSTSILHDRSQRTTDTRFAAPVSSLYNSARSSEEKLQRSDSPRVERTNQSRSTDQKIKAAREVEKVAATRREPQETKLWGNAPGPSMPSVAQSSASNSSSPFTSLFQTANRPAARQVQRDSALTSRSARTATLQQSVSLRGTRSAGYAPLRQRDAGTRVAQPRQGKGLRALTRSLTLIRNLERAARAVSRSRGLVTSKTSQRVMRAVRQIERLVASKAHSRAHAPQQRKALDNLGAVAQALIGSRNARDNRIIARVMSNALRRLRGGIERRIVRCSPIRRGARPAFTRALMRKALLNARLRNIRGRLDRLKVRYKAKSSMTRRAGMKRTEQPRTLNRRGLLAKQLLRQASSRFRRKGLARQAATRRTTKSSTRTRNNVKPGRQRREVRMLRREVKALRQALQGLLPMMEMMKALSIAKSGVRGEEEFDFGSFVSERQLSAMLKRKSLSSRERRKIESKLARKRKAKGSGSTMKSATSSSGKLNTAGASASTIASKRTDQPKDAEMKSYAKSLSIFQMRTDDATDEENVDGNGCQS